VLANDKPPGAIKINGTSLLTGNHSCIKMTGYNLTYEVDSYDGTQHTDKFTLVASNC
jgi:hypothetical protein